MMRTVRQASTEFGSNILTAKQQKTTITGVREQDGL